MSFTWLACMAITHQDTELPEEGLACMASFPEQTRNEAITHQDTEIPEEGICCNTNSQEQIEHCRLHSEGDRNYNVHNLKSPQQAGNRINHKQVHCTYKPASPW